MAADSGKTVRSTIKRGKRQRPNEILNTSVVLFYLCEWKQVNREKGEHPDPFQIPHMQKL